MQDLVGIVRTESEMEEALRAIAQLKQARRRRSACPEIASTTTAGTRRWICGIC